MSDAALKLLVCPICSQKLRRMNSSHLRKHSLTIEEFNAKYGRMVLPKPPKVDPEATIQCPLCDCKLRRMNSSHLKKHGLTMGEFNATHGRMKTSRPRKVDSKATVECPVCHEKFRYINSSHLRTHGITMDQFKEQYGAHPSLWCPALRTLEGTDVPGPGGHISQSHKKATRLVRYAIQVGRLNKPKHCSRCGRGNAKIQAHHPDYSKPLDVVWLCEFCHRGLHAVVGRTG